MSTQASRTQQSTNGDELEVQTLYKRLLDSWNNRSAGEYAALIEDEGHVVGFDGSTMNGRVEIEATLAKIFSDHQTGVYVGKIRGVRFVTPEVAILRAVAGMVPAGKSDIDPAINAIQTLVASNREGNWLVSLFQNTPAQFHGRPELVQALTEELRQLL